MIDQIVDCGYDFGDAGFVVGSEQCGSVGHDQILSAIARQLGKFIGRECDSELGVEDYVASIVVLDYARIDVAARQSGDVSKWAMNPTVGTFALMLEGSVAMR